MLLPFVAQAAPGDQDPSFGAGGRASTPLTDAAFGIAHHLKGGYVIAGTSGGVPSYDFGVVRFRSNGSVDPSFGHAGLARIDFALGEDDPLGGLIVFGDGSIVVAGRAATPNGNTLALARLHADGALDLSFGLLGRATSDVANSAVDVDRGPGGSVLVLGWAGEEFGGDLVIARFTGRGQLDPSFGTRGAVTVALPPEDTPRDLEVRDDGRLIVATRRSVFRFSRSGALDPSFGIGGVVGQSFVDGIGMVLQPDNRIVVAGTSAEGDGVPQGLVQFGVTRLLEDGTVDSAFGDNGRTHTNLTSYADPTAVGLTATRAILVAGNTDAAAGPMVIELTPTGAFDTSFGGGDGTVLGDSGGRVLSLLADTPRPVVGGFDDQGAYLIRYLL